MAKIPLYEQNQLASQVTGTPGVDGSAGAAFRMINQAAEGVASDLASIARQNQIYMLQKEREQAAIAKQQQKMLDDVEVANHLAAISLNSGDAETQTKIDTEKDPAPAPGVFSDMATEKMNQYLDSVSDPNIRARVQAQATNDIRSRSKGMEGWALTQRTANAKANTDQLLGTFIERGGELGSAQDVGKMWEEIEKLRPSVTAAYGEKADEVIKKTKSAVTKEFLNGTMIRNWEAVEPMIKAGIFDSALSEKEGAEFIYKANTLAKAKKHDDDLTLKADSTLRQIESATLVVDTPNDDPIAIQQSINKVDRQIEAAKSLGDKASTSEINHYVSQKSQLTKMLDNVDKEKREDQLATKRKVYESQGAMNDREKLIKARERIDTAIRDKTASKEYLVNSVANVMKSVQEVHKRGGLDKPGNESTTYNSYVKWSTGILNSKKAGGGADPKVSTSAVIGQAVGKAQKFFQGAPPPPGKDKKQVVDQATSAYQQEYNSMVDRFRTRFNKEPGEADLAKIDQYARKHATGKVYGR